MEMQSIIPEKHFCIKQNLNHHSVQVSFLYHVVKPVFLKQQQTNLHQNGCEVIKNSKPSPKRIKILEPQIYMERGIKSTFPLSLRRVWDEAH